MLLLYWVILKNISSFSEDKSLFILISNDVILVPNGPIYHNEKLSDYFSFSQIEGDICCDSLHMIIENDSFNTIFILKHSLTYFQNIKSLPYFRRELEKNSNTIKAGIIYEILLNLFCRC